MQANLPTSADVDELKCVKPTRGRNGEIATHSATAYGVGGLTCTCVPPSLPLRDTGPSPDGHMQAPKVMQPPTRMTEGKVLVYDTNQAAVGAPVDYHAVANNPTNLDESNRICERSLGGYEQRLGHERRDDDATMRRWRSAKSRNVHTDRCGTGERHAGKGCLWNILMTHCRRNPWSSW